MYLKFMSIAIGNRKPQKSLNRTHKVSVKLLSLMFPEKEVQNKKR